MSQGLLEVVFGAISHGSHGLKGWHLSRQYAIILCCSILPECSKWKNPSVQTLCRSQWLGTLTLGETFHKWQDGKKSHKERLGDQGQSFGFGLDFVAALLNGREGRLPATGSANLGKLLDLSLPQFPQFASWGCLSIRWVSTWRHWEWYLSHAQHMMWVSCLLCSSLFFHLLNNYPTNVPTVNACENKPLILPWEMSKAEGRNYSLMH